MKFCVNCGHEFREGEQFCSNCGQKRDALPVEASVKEGLAAPANKAMNVPVNQALADNANKATNVPVNQALADNANEAMNAPENQALADTAIEAMNVPVNQALAEPAKQAMTSTVNVVPNEKNKSEKPKKKGFGIALIIILVLALGAGGFLLWQNGVFDSLFGKSNGNEVVNNQSGSSDATNSETDGSGDATGNAGDGSGTDANLTSEVKTVEVKYSIHTAEITEKRISAKVTSEDSSWLEVIIYSEDLKEVLATQKTDVAGGSTGETYTVDMGNELPEKYAYCVRLIDNAGEELCAPYIDVKNTTAYENMLAKKTDDFPADKVIVIESDTNGDNGGFFVVAEDTKLITAGTDVEFSSYDKETETLVLKSASFDISVGQKLVLKDNECLIALITVKEVSNNDGLISIVGENEDQFIDYFDFCRLSIASSEGVFAEMDESQSVEATTMWFTPAAQEEKQDEEDKGIEYSIDLPYSVSAKLPEIKAVSISGDLKGTASLVFELIWDKNFLPESTYLHAALGVKTSPVVNLTLEVGHDFDGKIDDDAVLTDKLMKSAAYADGVHIPIVAWGLNLKDSKHKWLQFIGNYFSLGLNLNLDITGELKGSVEAEFTCDLSVERVYDIVDTALKIPLPDFHDDITVANTDISFAAKAVASLFIGLKFDASAKVGKLIDLSIKAKVGEEAKVELDAQSDTLSTTHACEVCCSGVAVPVAEATFGGGIKKGWKLSDLTSWGSIFSDTKIEASSNLSKTLAFDFDDLAVSGYASLVHEDAAKGSFKKFPVYFGLGKNTCPNKLSKVSFTATGENDEQIEVEIQAVRSDGLWDAARGSKSQVITSTSNDYALFYPGTYTVTAEYEGKTVSKEFTVPEDELVNLSFGAPDYYEYIRDELLPKMGYADLSPMSDTFVTNKYYDNGDWYENTGLLSANIYDINDDGVDDCIVYYIDAREYSSSITFKVCAVYARVYTIKSGKIVPLGEEQKICSVDGVSSSTHHVGICKAGGKSYIDDQYYSYSYVAAGGQQPNVHDYFYGIDGGSLGLSMYTAGSTYDYQLDRKQPAGLRIRVNSQPFKAFDCSDEVNYTEEILNYLGFTDLDTIEYSCPEWLHSMMRHENHVSATLWGTESLIPSFEVISEELDYNAKGTTTATVQTTVIDHTDLRRIISELQ